MTIFRTIIGVIAAARLAGGAAAQQQSVVNSPHDLSASGHGAVHAVSEDEVCIFCHTPHNATPVRPLWNRAMPTSSYIVYASKSLDARPGQPTGASKLCLSCHDGTIALGSVVSRDQIIQMASGITTLPPGASNLGTDLSDDHPISFRYDASLCAKDSRLIDPALLPPSLELDGNRELQCTTCHDAHSNAYGDFLAMGNLDSTMCRSCHRISQTTVPSHVDCNSCHKTHTAPSGSYLLKRDRITTTCVSCHDGSRPGAVNIAAELHKSSVHDTNSPVGQSDEPTGHATCADCHEPHTMLRGSAVKGRIQPSLGRISGISASGGTISAAQNEYEVCFKCHSNQAAQASKAIPRVITQTDTRLEFDPSAISYHPVEAPGRNMNVPSLRPGWTVASVMNCSDCHNSDTSRKAGGSGPNGVHGSAEQPLLIATYRTADFTTESARAYALCYRCHERDGNRGILSDASFPLHRKHVVDARTPCSVCHDAHGISSAQGTRAGNSHLINFDTTVVFPDRVTGVLRYQSSGIDRGSCTLTCHGVDHSPKGY